MKHRCHPAQSCNDENWVTWTNTGQIISISVSSRRIVLGWNKKLFSPDHVLEQMPSTLNGRHWMVSWLTIERLFDILYCRCFPSWYHREQTRLGVLGGVGTTLLPGWFARNACFVWHQVDVYFNVSTIRLNNKNRRPETSVADSSLIPTPSKTLSAWEVAPAFFRFKPRLFCEASMHLQHMGSMLGRRTLGAYNSPMNEESNNPRKNNLKPGLLTIFPRLSFVSITHLSHSFCTTLHAITLSLYKTLKCLTWSQVDFKWQRSQDLSHNGHA